MKISKAVLDAHAQFGGDLEIMQKAYEYDDLKTEMEAMAKTLEFYADRDSDGYDICVTDYGLSTKTGKIICDAGDVARAALASYRNREGNGNG